MNIAVVGGGAAGMMAAITAAEQGAQVMILEHKDRIGKKLLSTGNGKCNYTNLNLNPAHYYTEGEPSFIEEIIAQFDPHAVIRKFQELGVLPKEKNGLVYPYSEQAAAVLDVLRFHIEELGITICTEMQIQDITYNGKFQLKTNQGVISADRLILACGSKAAPKTGSDGSGYELAASFGHHIIPVVPALVQLYGDHKFFREVAGVRCEARVTLTVNEEEAGAGQGELQLTDYGISGIVVFQLSRIASKALSRNRRVMAYLNFFPNYSSSELLQIFLQRAVRHPNYRLEQLLIGIFPKKLGQALIKSFGYSLRTPAQALKASEWKVFAEFICCMPVPIVGTKGFENCQVCAGGVDLRELKAGTLESTLQKGLYLAGELLDVDGICGGYNLQWAWSSGYAAGYHAAQDSPIDTLI